MEWGLIMTTVPTTRYWAPGENPTAAQMNQYYRDPLNWLRTSSPICRLYRTASFAIPHNTRRLVLFGAGTELEDNDSMHDTSTNTGRITLNTAGVYEVTCRLSWDTGFSTSNVSGYEWDMYLALNETATADGTAPASIAEDPRLQTEWNATGTTDWVSYGFTEYVVTNGGDQLTLWAYQNTTGATQNLVAGQGACTFSARWVGGV